MSGQYGGRDETGPNRNARAAPATTAPASPTSIYRAPARERAGRPCAALAGGVGRTRAGACL